MDLLHAFNDVLEICDISLLLLFCFVCFVLRQGYSTNPRLALYLLCSLGWHWIHSNPPASVSQMTHSQVYSFTLSHDTPWIFVFICVQNGLDGSGTSLQPLPLFFLLTEDSLVALTTSGFERQGTMVKAARKYLFLLSSEFWAFWELPSFLLLPPFLSFPLSSSISFRVCSFPSFPTRN